MTDKIDNGGPAYPVEYMDIELFKQLRDSEGVLLAKKLATFSSHGMTLRDYFAGQALIPIISQLMSYDLETLIALKDQWSIKNTNDLAAKLSYCYADTMIKARKE